MDVALYEKCSRENNDKIRKLEAEKEISANKWKKLMDQAVSSGVDPELL